MMNNPIIRLLPRLTGSRNPSDLRLLILIGIRDNMDFFKPPQTELLVGRHSTYSKAPARVYRTRVFILKNCFNATTSDRLDLLSHEGSSIRLRSPVGCLSRKYSTSVSKTKAATYESNGLRMVLNIWSPCKVTALRFERTSRDMLLLLVQKEGQPHSTGHISGRSQEGPDKDVNTAKEEMKWIVKEGLCYDPGY
ncbi:hypothetical protein Tco_0925788 [Tanacetum coccineum]|uniref:Uncharacterized protein n=1 Tax=Tanacetum coccineum TaxID=301880 RepID=A0ABQ5DE54_9ASTR